MIMDTSGRQPSQPVNQCKKISRCQDRAGFMPRVIQKCSGSPATSQHLCNCTGERRVHPVHLFTKLGTCPLTKSGGFPTPYPSNILRGPGDVGDSVDAYPLFVVGRRYLPSVLAFGSPAFECCINQYQACIAFAGGAFTDGVWGPEKTCYRCCGCYLIH